MRDLLERETDHRWAPEPFLKLVVDDLSHLPFVSRFHFFRNKVSSSVMTDPQHAIHFRVRYSETDQMRTYYNSRALEWFEQGRTELMRSMGKTYREMETLGVMLPVREAHVEYLGKAEYDDLLKMTSTLVRSGKARIRVDVEIEHAESGTPVCRGWTEHAIVNSDGRPIRPPEWLKELMADGG